MGDTFDKFRFMEQLRGVPMRPHDFRVLITLMTYADRNGGNTYPSITPTLTRDCQMDKKTVAAALKRLEALGLIRCVQRGGGGRGRSTVWQMAGVPKELRSEQETTHAAGGFSHQETTRGAGGFKHVANPVANPWLDEENHPSHARETPRGTPENYPSHAQKTPRGTGDNQGMTNGSTKGVPGGRADARASGARAPSTPQTFDPSNPHEFDPDEPPPDKTCPAHPAGTVDPCVPCKVARQSFEHWTTQQNAWGAWYFAEDAAQ
ncbi:helix-turn-helix domain-containing protein [Mycolicibacterium fortuitum]|uniref:helix-turn-helix domain-containing protein n=1 Tax=Mycolicibacterium fortuitum TaxID=1766 RepID=UPI0014903190|nr:helix-turn-helix domain-containing protein [Mycolicibacterium fortuitum]